jgi:hypothetical protein
MTRIHRKTIVPLLTALFLAALAPALRAGDGPQPPKDKQPDKLAEIQKQLDKMDEGLKEAFKKVGDKFKDSSDAMKLIADDIGALSKGFDKLKDDLKSQQKKVKDLDEAVVILHGEVKLLKLQLDGKSYPPGELNEIKAKLDHIENFLAQFKNGAPYQSKFPPSGGGKVLLINKTGEEILYLVNGQAHRVSPFETKVLDAQPAGILNYEVISPTWGMLKKSTNTLNPNETLTITVG